VVGREEAEHGAAQVALGLLDPVLLGAEVRKTVDRLADPAERDGGQGGGMVAVVAIAGGCENRGAHGPLPPQKASGCGPWGPFLYAAIAVVSALLFRSVFWMSERLAQDDVISTALFWSATLLGLLGSFREGKRLMREVWRSTNGQPEVHPS